jgi:hypothetical protein
LYREHCIVFQINILQLSFSVLIHYPVIDFRYFTYYNLEHLNDFKRPYILTSIKQQLEQNKQNRELSFVVERVLN